MRISTLLARNLTWYWRTNLAVLVGVATATGVLGGALLVGESVRASLRGLVLERLGNADFVVTRGGFFREQLAAEMRSEEHTSELQSLRHLVCRLLLEKTKTARDSTTESLSGGLLARLREAKGPV